MEALSAPKTIPVAEIVEMLPTADDSPILNFKNDTTVCFQALAVSVSTVVVEADYGPIVTNENLLQRSLICPVGIAHIPRKLGKDFVSTMLFAGGRAFAGCVP
jgi:hypothetical protein